MWILILWFISLPRTLGHFAVCGQNPMCLSWPNLKAKPATKYAWPHLIVLSLEVLQLWFIILSNGNFSFPILKTILPSVVLLSVFVSLSLAQHRHILIACYMWPTFQLQPGAYTLIKNFLAPALCRSQPMHSQEDKQVWARICLPVFHRFENLVLWAKAVLEPKNHRYFKEVPKKNTLLFLVPYRYKVILLIKNKKH